MKNAKDYIREDGTGRTSVTSLAYWLTPEGLYSSFTAAMLRDLIRTATDAEFEEAFDGATKDEATEFLAVFELCSMPYWGADELSRAIHDAGAGPDEKMVMRAVALAQKAGELPDVFKPQQGIEWAMDRGYLIGIHAAFTGVNPGTYGHPHNQLENGPHHRDTQPHAAPEPAPVVPQRIPRCQWQPATLPMPLTACMIGVKQSGKNR